MKLLWLDLETTGLDPRRDAILEVAASVADLSDPFNATPVVDAVLRMPHFQLSEFIVKMHTKNGLLAECERSTLALVHVEAALISAVPDVTDRKELTVLAGATVHFDLGFLREHMPTLAARLSHRCYDTSAVKLFCQSLGMPKLSRSEAHRAADDVLEAIDHARQCAAWLGFQGREGQL